MSAEIIVLIVITSTSLLTSFIAPIILCGIEFSRRITKSKCCNSSIELSEVEKLTQTTSKIDIKINEQQEQIKQIIDLFDNSKM